MSTNTTILQTLEKLAEAVSKGVNIVSKDLSFYLALALVQGKNWPYWFTDGAGNLYAPGQSVEWGAVAEDPSFKKTFYLADKTTKKKVSEDKIWIVSVSGACAKGNMGGCVCDGVGAVYGSEVSVEPIRDGKVEAALAPLPSL